MNNTAVLKTRLERELVELQQEIFDSLGAHQDADYLEIKQCLDGATTSNWPELIGNNIPEKLLKKKQRLEQILAALIQIDLNLYGYCADCEAQIEPELIEQDPAIQRCAKCLARADK